MLTIPDANDPRTYAIIGAALEVLEIKARSVIGPADHAQIISYLAATKLQVGLLFNFGTPKLEHKRFVRTGTRD